MLNSVGTSVRKQGTQVISGYKQGRARWRNLADLTDSGSCDLPVRGSDLTQHCLGDARPATGGDCPSCLPYRKYVFNTAQLNGIPAKKISQESARPHGRIMSQVGSKDRLQTEEWSPAPRQRTGPHQHELP